MKKLSKQGRTKAKPLSRPMMQTTQTKSKSLRGVYVLGGLGLFLALVSPLIPERVLESTYSYTFPNGHSTHSEVGLMARRTSLNWSKDFLIAAFILLCVPPLLASVRRAWQQRPQWTLPSN